ncbi:hypothetical protein GCM10010348_78720 [Streptomyces anthocyanicus]|uniref:hypothetical protein n=1 Tax=Streptomyces anthocyanicus TaxID=68174 RepID=UPI0019BC7D19|nr:hypothetical protein [Streptomyces anthocyanicus]GHC39626.1 hypothetical protein GCM10010348_78720 [Streptomyces anthocyanicus]
MSQPTPPMPDFPPTTAPKKSRTNAIIIGAAVAIIAAIIGTGVVVQNQNDDSKPAATAETSTPAEDLAAPAVEETEDPEPAYLTPDAEDFTVELRTTRRKCFGSAGCNVTVEPKLAYNGLADDLDPDATFEITYEIRGGGDGPVIETAELSDRTTLNFTPSLLAGIPSNAKLSVEITEIVERAY